MKIILLILALGISLSASADGLLVDAVQDIGKVGADKSLSRDSSVLLDKAAYKIERAAIVQAIQEDALTKRIIELESMVQKQQEVISKYQKIVAELEAKLRK